MLLVLYGCGFIDLHHSIKYDHSSTYIAGVGMASIKITGTSPIPPMGKYTYICKELRSKSLASNLWSWSKFSPRLNEKVKENWRLTFKAYWLDLVGGRGSVLIWNFALFDFVYVLYSIFYSSFCTWPIPFLSAKSVTLVIERSDKVSNFLEFATKLNRFYIDKTKAV